MKIVHNPLYVFVEFRNYLIYHSSKINIIPSRQLISHKNAVA